MKITKEQAKKMGIEHSQLCGFHQTYPDQTASMFGCKKCLLIEDPCGCDEDGVCEVCHPEMFESKENE